ncbi:MAG TPA: restriction endonuclease subunit S [Candidatus Dormibacteraeota bacterium]|nr:restriction endonuclease subunit S [Candidatus Dormibacteraeota bacterium]
MMKTVLLGEICEAITSGGTPQTSNPKFWGGGIPWLNSGETRQRYIYKTEKTITEEGVRNSSTRKALRGSTVIASAGQGKTRGQASYLMNDTYINQSIIELRPNSKFVDDKFLFYVISSMYERLRALSDNESIRGSLTTKIFSNLKIIAPSLEEQKKISDFLFEIDQKVQSNRQMNQTLEKIGQVLFKHYFIDNPEAKTWPKKSLDEIAGFLNGAAMQKFPADNSVNSLPVIKIREMSTGITDSTDRATTDIPEKYLVNDEDMLFSWSGTLIVKIWTDGDGALNQHLFKVTSEIYPQWFYYLWTKRHLKRFIDTAAGKATTMGHIQRHHLKEAKVSVPSEAELRALDAIFRPLHELQIKNSIQTRGLSNLRDSLLPRLISGKIKV